MIVCLEVHLPPKTEFLELKDLYPSSLEARSLGPRSHSIKYVSTLLIIKHYQDVLDGKMEQILLLGTRMNGLLLRLIPNKRYIKILINEIKGLVYVGTRLSNRPVTEPPCIYILLYSFQSM